MADDNFKCISEGEYLNFYSSLFPKSNWRVRAVSGNGFGADQVTNHCLKQLLPLIMT